MATPLAIVVVLSMALGVLFLAWVALAACQVSSEISQHEERLASSAGKHDNED